MTDHIARRTTAGILVGALALVLVVSAMGVSGCGPSRPPSGPAGIVGKITDIQHSGADWSILVVGGKQAPGAVSDRALCRVDATTRIVDANGASIGPEELTVGSTVAAWFTGAVAESYPVQGTAAYIQVRSAVRQL